MTDFSKRVYDSILGLLSNADNPTPLVRLNRVVPLQARQGVRQARVVQPLRGGEGPGGRQPRPRRRRARAPAPAPRRADVGQHRHWPRDDREREGLRLHRDDLEARSRRRSAPSLRLFGTESHRARRTICARRPVRPKGRSRSPRRAAKQPGWHTQSVQEPGEPRRALPHDGPRDVAADRGASDALRGGARHVRDHHRDGALPEGAAQGRARARRPSGGGARHPRRAELRQLKQTALFAPSEYDGLVEVKTKSRSRCAAASTRRRASSPGRARAWRSPARSAACPTSRRRVRGGLPGQRVQVRLVVQEAPARALRGPAEAAPKPAAQRSGAGDPLGHSTSRAIRPTSSPRGAMALLEEAPRRSSTSAPPRSSPSGHAPGAINVPLGTLSSAAARPGCPRQDAPIVAICTVGERSLYGMLLLKALGYQQREERARRAQRVGRLRQAAARGIAKKRPKTARFRSVADW